MQELLYLNPQSIEIFERINDTSIDKVILHNVWSVQHLSEELNNTNQSSTKRIDVFLYYFFSYTVFVLIKYMYL